MNYSKDGTTSPPDTIDREEARQGITLPPPAARVMWRIEHVDGKRFRTLDTMGLPEWTTDPEKALTFGLSEHAHAFSADDHDDVHIRPC